MPDGQGEIERECPLVFQGAFDGSVVAPPALASKLPRSDGARPLVLRDVPAVHALYRRHTTRVERSAAETAALLDCPRMSCLVRQRAGQVVAYACMGRGRDLADVIH